MKINDVIITEAPLPSDPNALAYDTGGKPAKIGNQSFATQVPTPAPGQGARKTRPDPKVMARQQELIAAGAKIKADGIPGPKTTQAEKDFGTLANSAKSGGGNASTQAQVDAANAQQAPQGSDTTTAAPAAEPAAVAANPGTPAAGVGFNQGAPNPEIARLQQLGGMQAQVANPLQPAPGDAAQAAAAPAPGDAAQAAAAPSALPNPWDGKDPAKAAAWSALSPEDQKWLGNADPTDKFILARSPSKGGFVGSITPNFMKKKQPAAAPAPGQSGQAAPAAPVTIESEDLTAMLRIAGLR